MRETLWPSESFKASRGACCSEIHCALYGNRQVKLSELLECEDRRMIISFARQTEVDEFVVKHIGPVDDLHPTMVYHQAVTRVEKTVFLKYWYSKILEQLGSFV